MVGVRWKADGAISGNDSGSSRLCVSVASSVGVGVFLIVGYVAKHVAGPATLISIVIAALIAVLSALCNIELSQRLPRKASPYTFSHVCLGRFASFLTGWTLIMEYAVAFAVVAKGVGLYIDTLVDDAMQIAFQRVAPLGGGEFLGAYFDFFGAAVVLLVGSIFLLDLQRRKWVDSSALVVSVAVVIFIITAGSFNANPVNWTANTDVDSTDATDDGTTDDGGTTQQRGFFPFGVMATFRGAALCTFAFIGIEMLMRSKRDTQRSVSYIGMLSFAMIFMSLLGCSVVLTLMSPHYLMHPNVPFPYAFAAYHFNLAKWIVSIAAIVILSTSLWTLMFPLKRQILTLAEDGLLPFAEHNRRALGATLLTIVTISSLFAGLFSMGQLIDLLSVGTLLMFIVVAVAIVMLRFSHQLEIGSISTIDVAELRAADFASPPTPLQSSSHASSFFSAGGGGGGRNGFASPGVTSLSTGYGFSKSIGGGGGNATNRNSAVRVWLRQIVGRATDDDGAATAGRLPGVGGMGMGMGAGDGRRRPTRRSFGVVKCALVVQLCAMVGTALTVRYAEENIYNLDVWAVALLAFFVLVVLLGVVVTAVQPQRINRNYYKVPLVAVTASLALFACVLLVGMLHYMAWGRFLIWVCFGVPVFVVARRRRQERTWRTTGGISKIQGMHNRGYVGGGSGSTGSSALAAAVAGEKSPTAPLAVQTATQMVEITEVDETEQLDMYVVPSPAPVAGTKRTLSNQHNDSNNNINNCDDGAAPETPRKDMKSASRTPSPSNSFDDIVLASDIIDSLSERREPNGKTYYVDEVSAPADESVQTKSSPRPDEAFVATTSTIAVVHTVQHTGDSDDDEQAAADIETRGGTTNQQAVAGVALKITAPTPAPSAGNFDYGEQLQRLDSESSDDGDQLPAGKFFIHDSHSTDSGDSGDDADVNDDGNNAGADLSADAARTLRTFDVVAAVPDVGDDEKPSTNAAVIEPDASAGGFKERLSLLLGQNRTLGRPTSAIKLETIADAGAMPADLISSRSRPLSESGARFTVTDVRPTDADESNQIPPPPVFIPHLYNAQLSRIPTPDYDDDDEDDVQPVITENTPAASPDSPNANSSGGEEPNAEDLKITIRAKLENILSRGPPIRVSMNLPAPLTDRKSANSAVTPPETIPESNSGDSGTQNRGVAVDSSDATIANNDADGQVAGELSDEHREPALVSRPTTDVGESMRQQQTMHRAVFKDVLKSITIDGSRGATKTARRPLSVAAMPATIEEARNSLRHVENTLL